MSTCRGGGARVGARPTLENIFWGGGGIYSLFGGPFFFVWKALALLLWSFSLCGGGGGLFSTYVEKLLGLFLYLQKFLRAPML